MLLIEHTHGPHKEFHTLVSEVCLSQDSREGGCFVWITRFESGCAANTILGCKVGFYLFDFFCRKSAVVLNNLRHIAVQLIR